MYNHAPADYVCPFCVLIRRIGHGRIGEEPSDIVYHDERVTALVSLHQWPKNPGNVIVVPNRHFENIYELPARYATDIHRVAKKIALAMKAVYFCDGVSTRQHNEPAGNQDVWHYHLHVTPRFQDDRLHVSQRELMPVEERAGHARRLRSGLARCLVAPTERADENESAGT